MVHCVTGSGAAHSAKTVAGPDRDRGGTGGGTANVTCIVKAGVITRASPKAGPRRDCEDDRSVAKTVAGPRRDRGGTGGGTANVV